MGPGWRGQHLPQSHRAVISQQHSLESLGQAWVGSESGKNGVWDPRGMPSLIRIPLTLRRKGGVTGGLWGPQPGATMRAPGKGQALESANPGCDF